MRTAIYARYSSELQDARSIRDQIGLARERAQREGWQVVGVYEDAAISGASLHNRPGLLQMLEAAKIGAIDLILTESLDRLSRDLEDIAGLHKRLSFLGIKIITLADGEVGKLHVGLKGLIASIYLDDLAQKTRRGQVGRVKAGRIPGGRCYGYDVPQGGSERGLREVNKTEASVIRRIFELYVAGTSPLKIASQLNKNCVVAPRGGLWNASTINGSRKRANGILSNELYAGRIVYNRQRFVKDPITGKRQARPNPRTDWLVKEIPELQIVETDIWLAAQARRAETSHICLVHRRRPKRPLSGLLKCGLCGASYIVSTRDWLGCSGLRNRGSCNNRRMITMTEVEMRVLTALQHHLLEPSAVQQAVEAYRLERDRLSRERAKDRNRLERDLAEIDRKVARLIAAIEGGDGEVKGVTARIAELEGQRSLVERELLVTNQDSIVAIHPQAARRYRERVAHIKEALTAGDEAAAEAVRIVRDLIGRIVVLPTANGQPMHLEIVGDLAKLMQPQEQPAVTAKVVAGTGFEPVTFRL